MTDEIEPSSLPKITPLEKQLLNRRQFIKVVGATTASLLLSQLQAPYTFAGQEKNTFNLGAEALESPEQQEQAIIKAVIGLEINNPQTQKVHSLGEGVLAIQSGRLFWVTVNHVVEMEKDQAEGKHDFQVVVEIEKQRYEAGSVADWSHTKQYKTDEYLERGFDPNKGSVIQKKQEGFAYYPLTGEILNQIRKQVVAREITPIAFDPTILHADDKLAIVRRDLAPEQQVQHVVIKKASNLESVRGVNPKREGQNTFTLVHKDGKKSICSGMSGGPLLAIDGKEQLTNRAHGLIVSLPESAEQGTDAFNSRLDTFTICTSEAFARPGMLINDDDDLIGREKSGQPVPVQKSQIRVVVQQ